MRSCVNRFGHNLQIAFDCNALRVDFQHENEIKNCHRFVDLNEFTIQSDLQNFPPFTFICVWSPRIGVLIHLANMTRNISCINGPNLNLLGQREPHIYGHMTLKDIEILLRAEAEANGTTITMLQSNSEGQIVDWLQDARKSADGVILNAAAYTHTSVAIHDALKALDKPVIEVHLSNPASREAFRSVNFISPVVTGSIAGLGAAGYVLALKALTTLIPSS